MSKRKINIELIQNYMTKNFLSNKRFCQLCNINERNFERLLKDDTNQSVVILINIAKVMQCRIEDLVNRENFND